MSNLKRLFYHTHLLSCIYVLYILVFLGFISVR